VAAAGTADRHRGRSIFPRSRPVGWARGVIVRLPVLDTASGFAEKAESRGIELAYRLESDVPRQLRGDSDRLRQILVNLIGNALKFTEQGEITLTCALQEELAEEVVIRFAVRDTGCGIAQDQQEMIFDAFSQADSSMSRTHGGTGLGLAICRQLCELMGGVIGVESEPGQGSTFWFTVRLKTVSAAASGNIPAARVLASSSTADDADIVAGMSPLARRRHDHA
jgi:signal transduction histidine kinase